MGRADDVVKVAGNRIWTAEVESVSHEAVVELPSSANRLRVPSLPKARSGKIMHRILKAKKLGQDPRDISTLEK